MRRLFATVSVLALSLGVASPALAADSAGARMARKAVRGFENITLGLVTEWPKTIYFDSVDHGIPYGATVGVVRGLGMGVLRTGLGVYELSTFPVPLPKSYDPMLSPEFPHDFTQRTIQ